MNEINLKYKINKYIKKGNFNVKLDVSEYTYHLLKHKYINNKMTGGNPNIINLTKQNSDSFFYVDLHGALLVKEHVTIPDNLIVILPSCCGKSNYVSKTDISREISDVLESKTKNEIDVSKPIVFNKKKHFIYIGGENICNMNFGLDFNMLSLGSIFNMNQYKNYELNSDGKLMKTMPLRFDEFIIGKHIINMLNQEDIHETIFVRSFEKIYDKYINNNNYYETNDIFNNDYKIFENNIYKNISKILKEHISRIEYKKISSILEKQKYIIDKYTTIFNNETGLIFDTILNFSIYLFVYALYFCMYDKDETNIKNTLNSMTSLELINKYILLNFILPTYFFKNKDIINHKLKNYYYDEKKFELILTYIDNNILKMCIPDSEEEKKIETYYKNIKIFIMNIIIYFWPFIIYYFHGYNNLTLDYLKIKEIKDKKDEEDEEKKIKLNDIFSLFKISESNTKNIIYINSCQGSVSNTDVCYLYKCIKMHTKKELKINEDIINNISNKPQLLANIYNKNIFFKVNFNKYFEYYLKEDKYFKNANISEMLVFRYFKKINNYIEIVDSNFINFFTNFFKYIQTKYLIHNEIKLKFKNNDKNNINIINDNDIDNLIYMNIYSSHIIQIMYDICDIIINNKIDNYLKNYVEKDFIYYTLKLGLVNEAYLIEDVKYVYDMIKKELEQKPSKKLEEENIFEKKLEDRKLEERKLEERKIFEKKLEENFKKKVEEELKEELEKELEKELIK